MPLHRIVWSSNGVIMAGIRANTAWCACNEEGCGSPVRSAVFSGVLQYTRRPWMATERAVDRSASVCRMPCGVRVRTCGARTQFSRSEHLDVPCLPGSFRGLLSLPQMASLPESGQGLRLYERYSSVCKSQHTQCLFPERARLSTMLSVRVCRYLA
jgi:hypothetical protein